MMMGWTEFENGGILTNAALMDWQSQASQYRFQLPEARLPVVMAWNSYLLY